MMGGWCRRCCSVGAAWLLCDFRLLQCGHVLLRRQHGLGGRCARSGGVVSRKHERRETTTWARLRAHCFLAAGNPSAAGLFPKRVHGVAVIPTRRTMRLARTPPKLCFFLERLRIDDKGKGDPSYCRGEQTRSKVTSQARALQLFLSASRCLGQLSPEGRPGASAPLPMKKMLSQQDWL